MCKSNNNNKEGYDIHFVYRRYPSFLCKAIKRQCCHSDIFYKFEYPSSIVKKKSSLLGQKNSIDLNDEIRFISITMKLLYRIQLS